MTQKQLNGLEISSLLIDLRHLRSPHGMGAVDTWLKSIGGKGRFCPMIRPMFEAGRRGMALVFRLIPGPSQSTANPAMSAYHVRNQHGWAGAESSSWQAFEWPAEDQTFLCEACFEQ